MKNMRYKGLFLADFLTSIALLGVIITILALSMRTSGTASNKRLSSRSTSARTEARFFAPVRE